MSLCGDWKSTAVGTGRLLSRGSRGKVDRTTGSLGSRLSGTGMDEPGRGQVDVTCLVEVAQVTGVGRG